MICSHCGGSVTWKGPAGNMTHTSCGSCGGVNCQVPEIEMDNCYLQECDLVDGEYFYPCRSCEEPAPIEEPEGFDPEMHYCGGSPRCCP